MVAAPSLQTHYRDFRQVLYGVQKDKPRWEQCVGSVSNSLPDIVGAMYVKVYSKEEAKRKVHGMIENIRETMKVNILQNLDWMDDDTKVLAVEKLYKIIPSVAYPEYLYNETKLLQDLENVILSEESFVDNALALAKINFQKTMRVWKEPVNRSDWNSGAAVVNAFYSRTYNAIIFPAGILQYPFFDAEAPGYVNFAGLGEVIGHEITHGFDDKGSQFDGDGNLKSWWQDRTLENYISRKQCFIEQYSNITEPITGLNLNGKLELGENIADNGGLKLAYKAYKTWLSKPENSMTDGLPLLLNYSHQQLFFISYAQIGCSVTRPQKLAKRIITDTHAPPKYRVNVPLQNFPEFSTVFSCGTNSHMNPSTKCDIW